MDDPNELITVCDRCMTAIHKPPLKSLEDTFPMVLYFGSDKDREEFIDIASKLLPAVQCLPKTTAHK